tara:strand:- start:157 stop:519 length:363 start_codon:yes stop_codon:yes gene_type:complete
MKRFINITFLIILLYILFYLVSNKNPLELFLPSIFGTDTLTLQPKIYPLCTPNNNCFPGSYARTQIYQNVCQPEYGLLKQKIPLSDNCQRTFNDYMSTDTHHYICTLNNHLQRQCQWIKK